MATPGASILADHSESGEVSLQDGLDSPVKAVERGAQPAISFRFLPSLKTFSQFFAGKGKLK